MHYGIQISKAGYDVMSLDPNVASDIEKLSLTTESSAFNLLKVLAKGRINLANGATQNIAHGLSYTPIVWVFLHTGTRLRKLNHDTAKTKAHVDGTNLTIRNNEGSAKDFYYYIFYDAL